MRKRKMEDFVGPVLQVGKRIIILGKSLKIMHFRDRLYYTQVSFFMQRLKFMKNNPWIELVRKYIRYLE